MILHLHFVWTQYCVPFFSGPGPNLFSTETTSLCLAWCILYGLVESVPVAFCSRIPDVLSSLGTAETTLASRGWVSLGQGGAWGDGQDEKKRKWRGESWRGEGGGCSTEQGGMWEGNGMREEGKGGIITAKKQGQTQAPEGKSWRNSGWRGITNLGTKERELAQPAVFLHKHLTLLIGPGGLTFPAPHKPTWDWALFRVQT